MEYANRGCRTSSVTNIACVSWLPREFGRQPTPRGSGLSSARHTGWDERGISHLISSYDEHAAVESGGERSQVAALEGRVPLLRQWASEISEALWRRAAPREMTAVRRLRRRSWTLRSPTAMFSVLLQTERREFPAHRPSRNLGWSVNLAARAAAGLRVYVSARRPPVAGGACEAWGVFSTNTMSTRPWNTTATRYRNILICDIWSPRISPEVRAAIARSSTGRRTPSGSAAAQPSDIVRRPCCSDQKNAGPGGNGAARRARGQRLTF
jgi:hypothetical protein